MSGTAKHPWPDLHKALLAAGWTWSQTSHRRHQYRPPPDRPDAPPSITFPATTGGGNRARANAESEVRRWTRPPAMASARGGSSLRRRV